MSRHNDTNDIVFQCLSIEKFFNRFYDKTLEIESNYCSHYLLGSDKDRPIAEHVNVISEMDSENRLVIGTVNEDKDNEIMTVEDRSSNTGTDVLVSKQLKKSVNMNDESFRLSVPTTTTTTATVKDKTSEIAFPSVRQLVHQFDAIVERKRKGVDRPSSGVRKSNIDNDDYKIKVQEIRFRFELNNKRDISNEKASGFSDKGKFPLRERKRNRTNSLREELSPPSLLWDVNRRSSCVDDVLPKSIEESLDTLRIRPLDSFEMMSLSDSDLCRKDPGIPILPRLDSGTSDLSLEGYPVLCSSWAKYTKEPKRRLSASPLLSLSPAVSPFTESAENISLSRSLSCGFLSLSSDGSRKRSNSSDSAVEVEEVSGFSYDSGGSLGRSFASNLAHVERKYQDEYPCLVDNYWKDNLGLSSLPAMEHHTPRSEDDKGDDVVLRSWSSSKRTHRTPSVVISDHSGHSVSVHVAYASEDFSLKKVLSSSTPELACDEYICNRKASECSTCSSLSTLDTGSCVWTPGVPLLGSISQRRLSDCSTCSYLTCSDDEVEVSLQQLSPKPVRKEQQLSPKILRKNSNWRKVRNVVQWTPFIQTYKRHKYPWVQLAGHQGNFKAGYKQGTIMKKLCQAEETAFEQMQNDVLLPYVPEYLGIVEGSDGEKYLQLQDLLSDFSSACVMDIKMGVRTYLEEELAKARHKPKLRKDMYEKMIQIDPNAPTEAEQRAKAVTKPRYMVWRETISSTATLGFRIEGIRRGDGTSSKDFKTTRTREQVMTAISGFVEGHPKAVENYVQRLKEIKSMLEKSKFFKSHELIGSSLLFVHNESKSGIWLIDFAKTVPLPSTVKITHKLPWVEGTHEDGYLIGFNNLADLIERLHRNPPVPKVTQKPQESSQIKEANENTIPSTKNPTHEHCNSTPLESTQEQRISETVVTEIPEIEGEMKDLLGPPPHKPKAKNGNVTDVIERKIISERKAD